MPLQFSDLHFCKSPVKDIHIALKTSTGHVFHTYFLNVCKYLEGRPPEKTRLLLEEVLVRPAGGAHPVVCVGPNDPV